MDGDEELCQMIKEMNESVHFIFVTDEEENEILALQEGIQWYIDKKFEIKSTPRLNENPEDE
jgi:DNA-binding response OmpR family regulator